MFNKIKEFFTGKPAVAETPAEVPYKVETPATSPVAEQASQAVVESIAPAKKPAAKKTAAKKPTAKKPRTPKAAK
jgi:hypothetical protein